MKKKKRCVFHDRKNIVANKLLAQLLQQALSINTIQLQDFFEHDKYIIDKINNCSILKDSFKSIRLQLKSENSHPGNIYFKPRFVDPLVMENKQIAKLSSFVN